MMFNSLENTQADLSVSDIRTVPIGLLPAFNGGVTWNC